MGHQLAYWRTGRDQTAWLSILIEAMERLSRPESRDLPIDPSELAALRARLSRPAAVLSEYRAKRAGGRRGQKPFAPIRPRSADAVSSPARAP